MHGAGHSYLIQHSAGSGKSKEIAWLAHDLSTLHGDDEQAGLREGHRHHRPPGARPPAPGAGPGVRADAAARCARSTRTRTQLREALEGEQARIIISTLQKFPFVLAQLDRRRLGAQGPHLRGDRRRGPLVADRRVRRRPQGGRSGDRPSTTSTSTTTSMTTASRGAARAARRARRQQPNLSFFAFTATPKPQDARALRHASAPDGTKRAVPHLLDAPGHRGGLHPRRAAQLHDLRAAAARSRTSAAARSSCRRARRQARLTRFARFHPYLKAQKAGRRARPLRARSSAPQLGGEAKAMVVTAGREEAVQLEARARPRDRRSDGSRRRKTLVAFSGEVDDHAPGRGQPRRGVHRAADERRSTASSLPEKQLPDEFDKPEYGILVVAEKYQTGFDQPKLVRDVRRQDAHRRQRRPDAVAAQPHAPAEDRDVRPRLRQRRRARSARTSSRSTAAPRRCPTDPNVLFDAQQQLLDRGVIHPAEVDAFAAAWFVAGRARPLRAVRPDAGRVRPRRRSRRRGARRVPRRPRSLRPLLLVPLAGRPVPDRRTARSSTRSRASSRLRLRERRVGGGRLGRRVADPLPAHRGRDPGDHARRRGRGARNGDRRRRHRPWRGRDPDERCSASSSSCSTSASASRSPTPMRSIPRKRSSTTSIESSPHAAPAGRQQRVRRLPSRQGAVRHRRRARRRQGLRRLLPGRPRRRGLPRRTTYLAMRVLYDRYRADGGMVGDGA